MESTSTHFLRNGPDILFGFGISLKQVRTNDKHSRRTTMSTKNPSIESIESTMDQMIQEFVSEQKFMGCVLLSVGDTVLLNKGYGYANLEWDIPHTPKSKFQIASCSKQFTAAAILLLHDRGLINIDDLAIKYLPDAPASWDKITIFHLLTHTSGLHDYNDADVASYFTPWRHLVCTPENVMGLFSEMPLEFEPGEKFEYCGSGYVVLGRIIESVSGKSYGEFLRENIFEPLDMGDSGNDSHEQIMKNRVAGYVPRNGELLNVDSFDVAVCFAGGSLYSTVEDLRKWPKGLFGGKVLSESSLKKMITPFKENYAFGLQVTAEKGRKVIRHKGKMPGFKSVLSYYPGDQMTVAVLSNNEYGSATFEIGRMAAAIARGEKYISPLQRKSVELIPEIRLPYVGEYKLENGQVLSITPLGDTLMALLKDLDEQSEPVQDAYWLSAESNSKFFSRERPGVELEFFNNDQDKVSHLVLNQGKETFKAVRK